MTDYELEDTPEIAVADNPIGKLLLLIIAALTVICLYYFATELSRPEPSPETARANVASTLNP